MESKSLIENFRNVRLGSHGLVEGLSEEALLVVPPHLKNNIAWNFGHILLDACDMLYRTAGLPWPVPMEWEPMFCGGSSPADWKTPPNKSELLAASDTFTQAVLNDYARGAFRDFDASKVHSGWPLHSIEHTIAYHTTHEAVHIGIMMALRHLATGR